MNLKYNRIDMKNKSGEGNYSMKLRKRPSYHQIKKLLQPAKKKIRINKIKRTFGTDLTNQASKTPIQIQPQLNENTNALSQIQPYLFSITTHIDNIDSAYLNNIMQQLVQNSKLQMLITDEMRRVLLRWLIQVGAKFQVKNETIHICTQIIDYVLLFDNQKINKENFQLLGIAAMFVASKYNQIHTYEAAKYVFVCDGLYTVNQLFQMQGIILAATKFNLQFPTIHQYIGIIAEKAENQEMLNNILLLSNLSMLDFTLFNRYKKRHLAAVILYFALKLENPNKIKSKDVIQQANMSQRIFKECLQLLLNLYRQRQRSFNK